NNYNDVERREEKFCKICHESSSSSQTLSPTQPSINSTNSSFKSSFWSNLFAKKHKEKNKLISPCRCKGSLQYVHLECLNKWRKSNTRSDSAYQYTSMGGPLGCSCCVGPRGVGGSSTNIWNFIDKLLDNQKHK
ncbi:5352_t:CDS:2, partial [Entrophospora sp. SA101]